MYYSMMGVSRSPTIVLAYLMHRYKMTTEDAIAYVKKKRPHIDPNEGFMKQLKEFEGEVLKK